MIADINNAVKWALKQQVEYGEVTLRFVFHDGELRQIEKELKEKVRLQGGRGGRDNER